MIFGNSQTGFFQLRSLEMGKHDLRKHQFLRQKLVIECLVVKEFADRNEIFS